MSQASVERVLGLLAGDKGLRRRFRADPADLLAEMADGGLELNVSDIWSLVGLGCRDLARLPRAIALGAPAIGPNRGAA